MERMRPNTVEGGKKRGRRGSKTSDDCCGEGVFGERKQKTDYLTIDFNNPGVKSNWLLT